ncbi:MAG: AraC family transcriptional regulator [Lewinella sp.]|jgi:AraC-like DNA-binding protein|uniref:AraC family transcriptional regulator n=1 Tax=Lewinella sp. TaxID=2004506 RepID=UPI003D6AF979
MKIHQPIPFKIPKSENHALLVQVDEGPFFYNQLHYHPEFQITAIVKGDGIFYAGNNMTTFTAQDVFIIGANVPHLLKCSKDYHTEDSPGVEGVSLFFDEYSFGKQFFEIRELHHIRALLQNSKRVIKVEGELKETIFNKITTTTSIQEEQLIIRFLETLSLLRQADKTYINGEQYNLVLDNNEGDRLNEVLAYTFKNLNREITIDQISQVAFLSRSQFSYFFKLHTGKTYISFLNALRIENACILLRSKNQTIEQICYEVGFQNVSNFVRHFKKVKGLTPSRYRKSWAVK